MKQASIPGQWTHASRKPRGSAVVALVVAGLTLGLVGPAAATITPTSTALTIATAIATPSVTVTGASFAVSPPSGTPNGVSDSALAGFPLAGATYGILTSGNVSSVDQPGTLANTGDDGPNVRGDTDYDVSILKIDLTVPAGANCLTFNFKFLSEEYPNFVGGSYNDAFIAELDTSNWSTSGSTISAPNNFAFDGNNEVVSVNSTGLGGMTPADGAGTAFDSSAASGAGAEGAATALLGAATPVTPGGHSLYLSLFDQGDVALDSAVFLDNLRAFTAQGVCQPGATEAAHLTLVKAVDNGEGGDASPADWMLSATGPTSISGHSGDESITNAAVAAGTYTLAEAGGPSGYNPSAWSCTGGSLTGSSLDLAAGETASCMITNTFVPSGGSTTTETCPPTASCETTPITSTNGTTATIQAGPGATITASFVAFANAHFSPCKGQKPRDPANALVFNVTGDGSKIVTLVVNGKAPVPICWNQPTTFKQKEGKRAKADPLGGFTGLLPDCKGKHPVGPCILPAPKPPKPSHSHPHPPPPRTTTVRILAPPGDPKLRA